MKREDRIQKLMELIKAHPKSKDWSDKKIKGMAEKIFKNQIKKAMIKHFMGDKNPMPDTPLLFPTVEEARKIAAVKLGACREIIRLTEEPTELSGAYNIPPGCWYFIHIGKCPPNMIQSASYIAISKVDGRFVDQGSLNDEG